MKKKLIAGFSLVTLLSFAIILFNITGMAKADTSLPDKNTIQAKVHFNKVEELLKTAKNENEQSLLVNNYLSNLNSKELLETAAEYSEASISKQNKLDYLSLISPHLVKAWQQGVPYGKLSSILKDKTYNNIFRMFISDAATNLDEKKGQRDAGLIDSIFSIAQDSKENSELRRYVLLDLTEPGIFKSLNDTNDKSKLYDIFLDPNSPIEVKSAVITAMRRTQDPNFKDIVVPILQNIKSYPSLIIRHTVVESAVGGYSSGYIKQLSDLSASTMDQEVYGSTILALGISGGMEAISAIVSNYGRFDNPYSYNYSLQRNEKTIMKMLDYNQPSNILQVGITAAKLLQLDSFITPLKRIRENSKDPNLLVEVDKALTVIESNSVKSNPKWEEFTK